MHPVHIVDQITHAPLDISTRAGLGGTSSAWGGLCVPYDPIDFVERPWVSIPEWPITYGDVSRWHAEAGRFLDCGTIFEDAGSTSAETDDLDTRQLGRLARTFALGTAHRRTLAASRQVTVCLGTQALGIVCDPTGGHVIGVDVSSAHGAKRVLARRVVLAAGGLRTTQMLLALARAWPRHFAAGRAPLGKYYMGHLTGEIATLVFRDPRRAIGFLYDCDAEGRWAQRRLKISPQHQTAKQLLNIAFTLRAPPLNDYRHGDGALSSLVLLTSFPLIAKIFHSERMQESIFTRKREDVINHLRNIVCRPASTIRGISTLARLRREKIPIVAANASGRYSIRYHAEQLPNPDSRAYLENDASKLVVDFRYHPEDFNSVVHSHELLDDALRTAGIGHLEYHTNLGRPVDAVRALASDGYHQIGTTRMSSDPLSGVVDPDCCVHGLSNLYVASASTFPTSGSANPTLPIVTMALRLADHICATISRDAISASLPASKSLAPEPTTGAVF
ncbi:GMC oxidoreductase [Methylobacterium frigidaeris]|nr:GMC oxidoreductase [Methylobacterium frigidaeris]